MNRLLGAFALTLFLWTPTAQAATLYFDPGTQTIARGDALKVSVRLDTDEATQECINAIEGVVDFSGPIEAIDISTGDSIFSIWVEPPTINERTGQVTFAGGIPNGYCGRVDGDPRLTNNVFDIIVRAEAIVPTDRATVPATVAFTEQTLAYQNDGLGTSALLTTTPALIDVLGTMNAEVQDPWTAEIEADQQPPQAFSISLHKGELEFSGNYYILFNAADKQTGIDRYEVTEEPLSQFNAFTWGGTNVAWREARSPYILRDQSLNSTIRVRAIDKAGNEYVATLVPDESFRTLSLAQLLWYVLITLVLTVFVVVFVWVARSRRVRRHAAQQAELDAITASYQSYEEPQ